MKALNPWKYLMLRSLPALVVVQEVQINRGVYPGPLPMGMGMKTSMKLSKDLKRLPRINRASQQDHHLLFSPDL